MPTTQIPARRQDNTSHTIHQSARRAKCCFSLTWPLAWYSAARQAEQGGGWPELPSLPIPLSCYAALWVLGFDDHSCVLCCNAHDLAAVVFKQRCKEKDARSPMSPPRHLHAGTRACSPCGLVTPDQILPPPPDTLQLCAAKDV
jgi:hypothetical protein